MQLFTFGILGPGRIARHFCDAVSRLEGVTVGAVASHSGKAEAFAREEGISLAFSSYGALLARPEIDCVYIATTHNFHYENILQCLEAGKPVLCEKPMVLTEVQATRVFTLAREKGLFIMEAMWSRFLPVYQKAKAWIDAGRLGRIVGANTNIAFRCDTDPEGRLFHPDLAGGALYDTGVYAFELTDYLIPETLTGIRGSYIPAVTGVDQVDSVILEYPSCAAVLQVLMGYDGPRYVQITGTEGTLTVENAHFGDTVVLRQNGVETERFHAPFENGFVYQIAAVVEAVRAGWLEHPVMPAADTVGCARLFDTVLRGGGGR